MFCLFLIDHLFPPMSRFRERSIALTLLVFIGGSRSSFVSLVTIYVQAQLLNKATDGDITYENLLEHIDTFVKQLINEAQYLWKGSISFVYL